MARRAAAPTDPDNARRQGRRGTAARACWRLDGAILRSWGGRELTGRALHGGAGRQRGLGAGGGGGEGIEGAGGEVGEYRGARVKLVEATIGPEGGRSRCLTVRLASAEWWMTASLFRGSSQQRRRLEAELHSGWKGRARGRRSGGLGAA
jgi:hypothetical protein